MKSREAAAETTAREMQILLDEAEKENISLDARLAEQDAVKSNWQTFVSSSTTSSGKAKKGKRGLGGGIVAKGSIFSSSETGKVGVVRVKDGLTAFDPKKRHKNGEL